MCYDSDSRGRSATGRNPPTTNDRRGFADPDQDADVPSDTDDSGERPSWTDAPESPEPGSPGAPEAVDGAAVPLDATDAQRGRQAFVRALKVRRNAKLGVAVGVGFAALVFGVFVVAPATRRSPLWYVALGFVLAVSVAGGVAFCLTLLRAYRLSRQL